MTGFDCMSKTSVTSTPPTPPSARLPLKVEINLNNVQKSCSHLTVNTMRPHYKDQNCHCCAVRKKHVNILCGQNTKIFNIKVGGTYSYHCALEFSTVMSQVSVVANVVISVNIVCPDLT